MEVLVPRLVQVSRIRTRARWDSTEPELHLAYFVEVPACQAHELPSQQAFFVADVRGPRGRQLLAARCNRIGTLPLSPDDRVVVERKRVELILDPDAEPGLSRPFRELPAKFELPAGLAFHGGGQSIDEREPVRVHALCLTSLSESPWQGTRPIGSRETLGP